MKPPSSIQILTILGDMAKEEPVPEAGFLFITPALESERPRPRTETGVNAYSGSWNGGICSVTKGKWKINAFVSPSVKTQWKHTSHFFPLNILFPGNKWQNSQSTTAFAVFGSFQRLLRCYCSDFCSIKPFYAKECISPTHIYHICISHVTNY